MHKGEARIGVTNGAGTLRTLQSTSFLVLRRERLCCLPSAVRNAEDFLTWTRCILCIFMEYFSKTSFVFDPDTEEFTPLLQLSKCRKKSF